MEDLQMQLERTRSELVIACARLRGTDVLARNCEELRRENDILREQLQRYEDALLSVENRLETLGNLNGGVETAQSMDMSRPVAFSSLLEENQRLSSIIEMYERQRLPGQDSQGMNFGGMSDERAALEARIEELQAENEFIREEWQQVQSATTTAAKGVESSDVEVLEQRLERSERAVVTKTRLCEMLTAELQKRQQQAPTPNQQCCKHQAEAEQLNEMVAKLYEDIDNVSRQRQEDNANFSRLREEMERRSAEQQALIQGNQEREAMLERTFAAEKQELTGKQRQLQNLVAQLNENFRQAKRQQNQLNATLSQTQYKLNQMTTDRDTIRQHLNQSKEREQKLSERLVEMSDNMSKLHKENIMLKEVPRMASGGRLPPTGPAMGYQPEGLTARDCTPTRQPVYVSDGMHARGDVSRGARGGEAKHMPFAKPLDSSTVVQSQMHGDRSGEMKPIPFVKPMDTGSGGGGGSVAASGHGVERVCPVCKKAFKMEIQAFYKHCDMCAEKQG